MNLVDDDFLEFAKLMKYMNIINPEILKFQPAMLNLKDILSAPEGEFKLMCLAMDKKLADVHKILRDAYQYYLQYGGMVLENSFEYRERFFEIMKNDDGFMGINIA